MSSTIHWKGLFACGDGVLTAPSSVCDLIPDCVNGKDEANCSE